MTSVEFGNTLWANCQECCTAFQEHMRKTFESGNPLFGYECCQKFAPEAFIIHLWIMSGILSGDTKPLDVLHDHCLRVMGKVIESQQALDHKSEFNAVQALLQRRYQQYYAAEAEDHRDYNQGVTSHQACRDCPHIPAREQFSANAISTRHSADLSFSIK